MGYPRVLHNFNVFLESGSLAGLAKEVVLPKLTVKSGDLITAGMAAPITQGLGSFETLTLSMTVAEATRTMITGIGSVCALRFVGALVDDTNTPSALEVYARGLLTELDLGTAKREASLEPKLEMKGLRYFRLTQDNEVLVEIDALSGLAAIGTSSLSRDILRLIGITV